MVLSELCTVFPVPPSHDEVGRPERLRVVGETEDSCEDVPWGEEGLQVESGEASGDLDGIEPGLAAWKGARNSGVGEGEVTAIPASRGLLLEFMWPRLGVPAAARRRKSTKSNLGVSEQSAGPNPREFRDDGVATACSTASDGEGGQTRVSWLPQRPPSDSSGSWSAEGRLGRSHPRYFLVLTLAFLRALVEKHSTHDDEVHAGGAGRLDGAQPTAGARPCLTDALSRVPTLDANSGLHGRLIDEIPPALYQTLVTIVDQALRPTPDMSSRSEDGVGSEGDCNRWHQHPSQLGAFLGSAVRDVLESRGKRTDTVDCCISGGGVDSHGNASGERLGHFEPTRPPGVQLPPDHDLDALSPVSSKRYVPDPPRGRCNARSVRPSDAAEDNSDTAHSSLVAGLCSASANTGNESDMGVVDGLLLEQGEKTAAPREGPASNSLAHPASASCLEGCDVTVLAEMQRVNSHAAFPGLAEDARTFAKVLSGLAEHGCM